MPITLHTVAYRKKPDFTKSAYQNANRRAGLRVCESYEAALAAAAELQAAGLEVIRIFDYTGKTVARFIEAR